MKSIATVRMYPSLLVLVLTVISITQSMAQVSVNDYQQFMAAYNDKKYEQCIQLGAPLAKQTDHPGIQYKLAACYCQSGMTAQSLDLLDLLTKRGLPYKVEENVDFSRLLGDKRFTAYTKVFMKNRVSIDKSTVSFVINDSLLIPEGITYDATHQTFYVGSLARQKVVRCSGTGECTDFVTAERAGFWMVVGMKVSPDAKSLWICSASERDTVNGYAGIFQFEISSGKLLQKFVMDNKKGGHLFNDIVITQRGDVYFTDSKDGKVWRLPSGSTTLAEHATGFVYPNGIALDEQNKVLFVADFTGLHVVDLASGKRSALSHQGKTYLTGIDGLYYYKGTLLAIQDSGNQDDRVVRFQYDLKKNIISKTETLQSFRPDFIFPTTGTFVNGQFHYIANAQLRNLQPDGSLVNPEKLVRPVILKLNID